MPGQEKKVDAVNPSSGAFFFPEVLGEDFLAEVLLFPFLVTCLGFYSDLLYNTIGSYSAGSVIFF